MLCLVSKPVAEVAKQIRAALKRNFPDHLFSVRSSPTLIRVRWCDGPVEDDVQHVVCAITRGTQVSVVYARWSFGDFTQTAPA